MNGASFVAPSITDAYRKELEKNKRKELALGRIPGKSFSEGLGQAEIHRWQKQLDAKQDKQSMFAPREDSWCSSGLAEFQAVLKNFLDILNTAQHSREVQGSGMVVWRSGKIKDEVSGANPKENDKT